MSSSKPSWQDMHIDDGSARYGIIATEAPVKGALPNGYVINSPVKLTPDHLEFMKLNGINENGTCNLVDPTLEKVFDNVVFECTYTPTITDTEVPKSIIVGLIMTLPHHITLTPPISLTKQLKGLLTEEKAPITSKTIKIGLTTHLCVHMNHRDQGIAMALIRAVVDFGYTKYDTYSGYHYFSQLRTAAAIDIKPWFRVLNPIVAGKFGYELAYKPLIASKSRNPDKLIKMAYMITKPTNELVFRPTQVEDFKHLIRRVISITPFTDDEWKGYAATDMKWKTFFNKSCKGMTFCGIAMYRSFDLVTRSGIAKAAQVSFFEVSSTATLIDINNMYRTLLSLIGLEGYVAVHGSMMGPLNNEEMLVSNKVACFASGSMYLDFYNVGLSKMGAVTASDVSLLYI
jgi:hypothetical protein